MWIIIKFKLFTTDNNLHLKFYNFYNRNFKTIVICEIYDN